MAAHLQPCPFCGGAATMRSAGGWWGAGCQRLKCPAMLHALQFRTEGEATYVWNTRRHNDFRGAGPQRPAEVAGRGIGDHKPQPLTIGTVVSAPRCDRNPAASFRVVAIEEEPDGRLRVRGRDTCWFFASDLVGEGGPA